MNKFTLLSTDNEIINSTDGDEAFASITLNPTLKWMKFILLDSEPNQNKQRVPEEEFDNIIKSGINMPIKMAMGAWKEGHKDSFPIGVITHLKKIKNRIEGLAALWHRERPEDVEYLESKFDNGEIPQVSFELPYEEIIETNGIKDLKGTVLRAATIVGMPAYAGRTPVIAFASTELADIINKISEAKILDDEALGSLSSALKDVKPEQLSNTEELNVELEQLKEEVSTLKTKLAEATTKLEEANSSIQDKETELKELEELKEFKQEVEAARQRQEKLASIKEKFVGAKIEKDEDYFTKNEAMLLALDDNTIDFMIQEMVAFASNGAGEGGEGRASVTIPNFTGQRAEVVDPKQLAESLKKVLLK